MAADQRRKRLSSSSAVGYSSREPYRGRKKILGFPHRDANLNSHITLEWDGSKKRVVSKREQIGIGWRKLRPFVDSVSNDHAILADVFDVPREIFDLENLSEVISLEVWRTHLSENERKSLRKFLPVGQEIETVLGALFSGDNFHFGNPLIKWEASLCSGALHPDAVLHHEQCLGADKKAHSRELQKYHNNMIGYLLKLKERCANCKDPEKEIIHYMRRSRNVEKRVSSRASESKFDYLEDNATATSESCSWSSGEKACSSDNQNCSMLKGSSERIHNKGYTRDQCRTSSTALGHMLNVGASFEKGDKQQKHNIHCSDGSKYMSYFKISKKQHDLVKNMKQSGSLNQVLGDIDSFNVQPYEVFVEEERKKLQEHWLQLSKIHLPVGHANWREIHLQRRQLIRVLGQDLKDRQTLLMDVDTESHDSVLQDQMGTEEADQMGTEEADQMDTEEADQMDSEGTSSESIEKSNSGSQSSQSLERINGGLQTDHSNSDPGNHDTPNSDDIHLEESGLSRNMNTIDCSASQGEALLSTGDVWPGADISKNYYSSATTGHAYASTSNLSLADSHTNKERKTQVFRFESDLPGRGIGKTSVPENSDDDTFVKSDLHGRDIGKILLPRQSTDVTFVESDLHGRDIQKNLLLRESNHGPFSNENQDKDELLHSLFESQGVASYHRKERHSDLDFHPLNNDLIEESQYSRHFQEHPDLSLPLEQGRKKEDQIYMQHGVPDNVFTDGNRYLVPTQQQLTSVGMQDWAVNSVRMSSHLHSHPVNGGGSLLGQNWFAGEHQVRGGFTGSDGGVVIPNQSAGSVSNTDQTLFSVLSHGNQLRSPFHSMGSNGQFISPRNYGMLREGNPMIGNVLPEASNPLDYLGGHEISQGMNWVGMRHQNSNLNDPMEKPYLRSWNQ